MFSPVLHLSYQWINIEPNTLSIYREEWNSLLRSELITYSDMIAGLFLNNTEIQLRYVLLTF